MEENNWDGRDRRVNSVSNSVLTVKEVINGLIVVVSVIIAVVAGFYAMNTNIAEQKIMLSITSDKLERDINAVKVENSEIKTNMERFYKQQEDLKNQVRDIDNTLTQIFQKLSNK